MKKTKLTRAFLAAASAVALSAVVYGCGGGGGGAPSVEPKPSAAVDFSGVTTGYLVKAGEYEIAAGGTLTVDDVEFSCAADGPDCTVTVAADGTATYAGSGGEVTAANSVAYLARLTAAGQRKAANEAIEAAAAAVNGLTAVLRRRGRERGRGLDCGCAGSGGRGDGADGGGEGRAGQADRVRRGHPRAHEDGHRRLQGAPGRARCRGRRDCGCAGSGGRADGGLRRRGRRRCGGADRGRERGGRGGNASDGGRGCGAERQDCGRGGEPRGGEDEDRGRQDAPGPARRRRGRGCGCEDGGSGP